MGVNCNATLSPKATWEYVGMVASILMGAKPRKEEFGGGHDGWAAKVDGFDRNSFSPSGTPSYIYIKVNGDEINPIAKAIANSDEMPYQMWYGLENRFLYPKATAAKIALTLGIVKFFGGKITYNDAEGESRTFKAPAYIAAEDGKPWYQLQQALLDLKPLTQKDIDAMQKWAAY